MSITAKIVNAAEASRQTPSDLSPNGVPIRYTSPGFIDPPNKPIQDTDKPLYTTMPRREIQDPIYVLQPYDPGQNEWDKPVREIDPPNQGVEPPIITRPVKPKPEYRVPGLMPGLPPVGDTKGPIQDPDKPVYTTMPVDDPVYDTSVPTTPTTTEPMTASLFSPANRQAMLKYGSLAAATYVLYSIWKAR